MQDTITEFFQPFSGCLDRFITLDTETTGFSRVDEVLQIGIVDHNSNSLIDSLVKPIYKKTWPKAELVNNISPQMVSENGMDYQDMLEKVEAIISNFENIIIYNASFDRRFFPSNFFKGKNVFCAMQLSIPYLQAHPAFVAPHRFLKLKTLCELFDITYDDIPLHTAAGDAELTRRLWQYYIDNNKNLDTPFEYIIGEWLFYQGMSNTSN